MLWLLPYTSGVPVWIVVWASSFVEWLLWHVFGGFIAPVAWYIGSVDIMQQEKLIKQLHDVDYWNKFIADVPSVTLMSEQNQ